MIPGYLDRQIKHHWSTFVYDVTREGQIEVKSDPMAKTMQSTVCNFSSTVGFTLGNTCLKFKDNQEEKVKNQNLKKRTKFSVCSNSKYFKIGV